MTRVLKEEQVKDEEYYYLRAINHGKRPGGFLADDQRVYLPFFGPGGAMRYSAVAKALKNELKKGFSVIAKHAPVMLRAGKSKVAAFLTWYGAQMTKGLNNIKLIATKLKNEFGLAMKQSYKLIKVLEYKGIQLAVIFQNWVGEMNPIKKHIIEWITYVLPQHLAGWLRFLLVPGMRERSRQKWKRIINGIRKYAKKLEKILIPNPDPNWAQKRGALNRSRAKRFSPKFANRPLNPGRGHDSGEPLR